MPTRRIHVRARRLGRTLQHRAAQAHRFLQRIEMRALLSVAIIVSLLPLPWVAALDPYFFVLFGAEFLVRLIALWEPPDEEADTTVGRHRATRLAFLSVDLLALFSFLPGLAGGESARWLRLFRLSRMLLLIGYWAPVVRDLRRVVAQRERTRQVLLMGFAVTLLSFAGAVLVDHLTTRDVDFNGNESFDSDDRSFFVRVWWAFRQVQDPGNMLASPADIGAAVVSLVLTVCGLFLVSFLIGLGTDVVRELLDLGRNRPPGFRGHLVVVNVTPTTGPLLHELMQHYQKLFATPRAALLGTSAEAPAFLDRAGLRNIAWRRGEPGDPEALQRVDSRTARRIVVLADPRSPTADAETTRMMLALRESNQQALLVAEMLDPRHLSAARVAGGARTVLVPTEKLLGLALAAAARQPRIDDLLLALLASEGHEIYTYLYDSPLFKGPTRPLVLPAGATLDDLADAGLSHEDGRNRVVLGVIESATDPRHPPRVLLGTAGTPGLPIHGLVAVAESFSVMRDFALGLLDGQLPRLEAPRPAPPLGPGADPTPRTVLICGFRPAVVHLLESLLLTEPALDAQVLVFTEPERRDAEAMLLERSLHQRLGLWHEPGPTGCFERVEGHVFAFQPETGAAGTGRIRLSVADWTSDADLLSLPGSGRSVADVDLLLAVGGVHPDTDARTAMAVLKIADLVGSGRLEFADHFRLHATVVDETLSRLLETRFRAASGRQCCRVLATRELGARFTFQSAVVPGFDAVYSELLSPWGQSFEWLVPTATFPGEWTFVELSRALRRDGRALLAVVVRGERGEQVCIAPRLDEPGALFDASSLVGVWITAEARAPAQPEPPRHAASRLQPA